MTKFGLKYYDSPSPKWIKILFMVLIAPAITTFLANITEFGFNEGTVKILQMFSPVIGGAVMYVRDLFGKKSLNEIANEKK